MSLQSTIRKKQREGRIGQEEKAVQMGFSKPKVVPQRNPGPREEQAYSNASVIA